jgi:histidyl-tRNA synthetase
LITVFAQMSFDMSLARGLDYYTGVIYEAVCEASAPPGFSTNPSVTAGADPSNNPPPPKPKKAKGPDGEEEIDESQVGVGSIAAGGRYDELVGMFATAAAGGKKAAGIPCVGVSVGVERVFSILSQKMKEQEKTARAKETEAYVMSVGDGLLTERMSITKQLWDAGIKVIVSSSVPSTLSIDFLRCTGGVYAQSET